MFSAERGHRIDEQLLVLWTWLLEGYVPVVHMVADVDELEGIDERRPAATISRRRMIAAAIAALVAATSAESIAQAVPVDPADARGAILVQVTDTSINPLPAEVVFPALGLGVRLSEEGVVLVEHVPEGLYMVEVRHQGYAPAARLVRITGDTARLDVVLSPAADAHGTPDASDGASFARARLHHFIERSATMTAGVFITRDEIRRRRARTASALLRGVPYVIVERDSPRPTIVRSTGSSGARCADGMVVSLGESEAAVGDGWSALPALRWVGPSGASVLRVSYDATNGSQTTTVPGQRITDIDEVNVSSVIAIEVYPLPGAAPPELRLPGVECGAVVIWITGGKA